MVPGLMCHCRRFLVPVVGLLLAAGMVRAQGMNSGMNLGSMQTMPGVGALATPSGSMFGSPTSAPKEEVDPGIAVTQTFVGIIDSAVPRNQVGLRFEGMYNNRQPMRAEYYHSKGGLPGSTGFPFVETRIDYQDLVSFAEYSWTPWFSVFMEAPYRWLNPEVNANRSGAGDVRYGLKLCTWSSDAFIATILVRLYQPSAVNEALGTSHWSIEPGILAAWQPHELIHVEGEFRWWVPLNGSDFAGDLLRYGVGISYGQKVYNGGVWYVPVAECVGWSVLSGKTMLATSQDSYLVREAHGQTIVNGYLGLRFGYGQHLDFYAGYGRSFTGDFWQRDMYRFEMRFSY